jgi:catechol 2,3-dioxygenase-like lactoylglutathione lyase family enzyme
MPRLRRVVPRLHVADLARGIAFYQDRLGFTVGSLWPEHQPAFAILEGQGLQLQLIAREPGDPPGTVTLWIEADDVPAWHAQLKDHMPIAWGPEVYSYQQREFAILDPDGHMLILSEHTTDPPTCPLSD